MLGDFKIIKDNYGEKMAHLCRSLFPTLLEQEGLLSNILLSKFSPNHYLYEDIINNHLEDEFKSFIYEFLDVEKETVTVNKTVKELLEEAGYFFYECHMEEEIQYFKKYYKENEELCTFNGGRLNKCHVFFAVKKNVEGIKRENFSSPKREDEYGVSVISIQFSKGRINTLSIKNRYNHTVNNPDATYSNNLDNIIPGLTNAFAREYNLNINYNSSLNSFISELSNYVLADDGKYYRYNYELDNIYYCMDNIIIDNGRVKKLDKSRYLLIDYFILDLVAKKIKLYSNRIIDRFIISCPDIDKIYIANNKQTKGKTITIFSNGVEELIIEINRYCQITHLKYNTLTKIDNKFLVNNKTLISFESPSLEYIGDDFLDKNESLINFLCPRLRKIGNYFLFHNEIIKSIILPELVEVGNGFLSCAQELEDLQCPNIKVIGDNFLDCNYCLNKFEAPNVRKIGNYFLERNEALVYMYMPKLRYIGGNALRFNRKLLYFEAPELKYAGDYFLHSNEKLERFYCPELEYFDENRILNALRKAENASAKIITKYSVYNGKEIAMVKKLSKAK